MIFKEFNYLKDKKFHNKYETWKLESGFNSLTNIFKRKGYNLLVVNSDGKKFEENGFNIKKEIQKAINSYKYFKSD